MTIIEIRNKVVAELKLRNLQQPQRRKNALERVLEYIEQSQYYKDGNVLLPSDKKVLKRDYETHKGNDLSGAESSVINEIYNQYEL